MCFDFLYNLCLKHFSFKEGFREIWSQMYTHIGLHVQCRLLLSRLLKLRYSRQIFGKYSNSKFHENPSCASESFHKEGRAHGQKGTKAHGHKGTRAHRHTGTRAHGNRGTRAHRHTGTRAHRHKWRSWESIFAINACRLFVTVLASRPKGGAKLREDKSSWLQWMEQQSPAARTSLWRLRTTIQTPGYPSSPPNINLNVCCSYFLSHSLVQPQHFAIWPLPKIYYCFSAHLQGCW